MVSPTKKKMLMTLLTNVCRVMLALVFMLSGFVKAVDPIGFFYKSKEYAMALGIDILSDVWLLFFAMVLVGAEFVFGFFLLTGIYRKVMSVLVFVLMLLYTPFTLYVALENPVPDCGCFGDAFTLSNWWTFAKNVFLLLMSVVVFFNSKLYKRKISDKNRWMAVLYVLFYVILIEGMSVMHLPVIDFRPFAVGVNLRDAVLDKPAEYETVAIYEKDGVQEEFLAGALPDSSWNYIGARNKVVKPGRPALINDFSFIDLSSDYDVADEMLADTGFVALLVMETLEKADESRVDKINDIYDYCNDNNMGFYAVTSSGEEAVELWYKRTGAEYPFYWADDILLKTMVRSNPGLLLLKDGRIVNKWNISDVPEVNAMSNKDDLRHNSSAEYVRVMRGWRFWLLLFALPMAFILFVDMFTGSSRNEEGTGQSAPEKKEIEITDNK